MKTNFKLKHAAIIFAGIFCAHNAQAQTYGAGNLNTGANGCTVPPNTGTCSDVYIGSSAGAAQTAAAINNTFIGASAGTSNTVAKENVAVGFEALKTQSFTPGSTWSSYNVAVGNGALFSNQPTSTTNGYQNTALGHKAGYSNTIGKENVFHGYEAGLNNTTGSGNTFLGNAADGGCASCSTLTYAAAIGYNAKVSQNNSLVLGGTGTYSVNVGIGTTTPSALLHLVNNANAQTRMFVENTSTGGSAFSGVQLKNSTGSSYIYMTSTGYSAPDVANALYVQNANGGDIIFYGNGEAMRVLNNRRVGIGTATPGYLLDVNGDVHITGRMGINVAPTGTNDITINGNGVSNTGTWTSDQQFKTNIDTLHNALTIIRQLKPKSFYFDTTNVYGLKFPSNKQYGFIAQDLEQVLPELVTLNPKPADVDSLGNIIHPAVTFKAVYYLELIAILGKGIQEQQKLIDTLFVMVNAKSSQRTQQHGSNDSEKNIQDIKLSLPDAVTLGDAQPNPNNGSTQIPYYLPENTTNAKIIFTDLLGRVMKEETLKAGYGLLNIDTQELPNGIYNYSLIVDGKVIDNKKMLRSK